MTQFLFMVLPLTAAAGQSSARLEVTVPDGFRVELIYAVPLDEQGSWVALTPDPTGRLITSDETGRLYRVTLAASSSTETETSKTSVELLGRSHRSSSGAGLRVRQSLRHRQQLE